METQVTNRVTIHIVKRYNTDHSYEISENILFVFCYLGKDKNHRHVCTKQHFRFVKWLLVVAVAMNELMWIAGNGADM